jgi:cytochrome P450
VIEMRNPALDAWGDYDRDDPYPLFAQVQADGPVHEVTLADGHRAWLIVRHEEAKAALNHAGLSKDMHAALARDGAVVAEGLPGPAFARHMLSVDPPDHTRLRRLTSAAFSRPRIAALRPRVQAIVDRLLDDLEARGDTVVDLVKGFAFPLPFTVISELLGVPEPDRDQPRELVHHAARTVVGARATGRGRGGLGEHRAVPDRAPRPQACRPGRGSSHRPGARGRSGRRAVRAGDALHDLPAGGRRARHHDQPDRQRTVALLLHPEQRDALVADPALVPHAIEEILRWDAPVPHSTFRYTTQDVALGGTVIPPSPR